VVFLQPDTCTKYGNVLVRRSSDYGATWHRQGCGGAKFFGASSVMWCYVAEGQNI
jgi:hypothetical protein